MAQAARRRACLQSASTPEVPFCAAPRVATAVVMARRSVLGGVRVIADSEAVGGTHRTESRRQFCQPCGRATRPTCLLPLLRPARPMGACGKLPGWRNTPFGRVGLPDLGDSVGGAANDARLNRIRRHHPSNPCVASLLDRFAME